MEARVCQSHHNLSYQERQLENSHSTLLAGLATRTKSQQSHEDITQSFYQDLHFQQSEFWCPNVKFFVLPLMCQILFIY